MLNQNAIIVLNSCRATEKLAKLNLWQNSSAVVMVRAPEDIQGLKFFIGTDAIDARYEPGRKMWRVYIQPLFLARSGDFCYTIRATDECGNACTLGVGDLSVKELPTGVGSEGASGEPGIIPANSYAFNPITGKYHRLIATQDSETGIIVVSVKQTGELL